MNKLDPEVTFLFFLRNCLRLVIFVPVWFGFTLLGENILHISPLFFDAAGMLVVLGTICVAYLWAYLSYSSFTYSVEKNFLLIRHGVLLPKTVEIHYGQIRAVEYYISPLLTRFFGIYSLHIDTNEKNLHFTIPGLSKENAQLLKGQIVTMSHEPSIQRKFFQPNQLR